MPYVLRNKVQTMLDKKIEEQNFKLKLNFLEDSRGYLELSSFSVVVSH